MPLIHCKNLSLAYGDKPLLDQIEFAIEDGERVALIGRNGEGKSSLLKILAGTQAADDGTIARNTGLTVATVTQEPLFAEGATVLDAVAPPQPGESDHEHEDWVSAHRVRTLISNLGLTDDMLVASLSGGQKKRVQLAAALAREPQLLLLDEPTNHLDIDGIEWLEATLKAFKGAILVVSHDRSFLGNLVTRIVELDRGALRSFPGSFAAYLERKAQMLADEAVVNAKFDKLLAQEEVWIRKGVEARRTRNEGRVRRLEQLRRERSARRERMGHVKLALDEGQRTGKLVCELRGVRYDIDGRTIIPPFSAVVTRGDKIGLIGPNGIGKTTLLKLILGDIAPTAGEICRPAYTENTLKVAYFDQFRAALDDNATLTDVISPGSDFVDVGGKKKHIMSYLEDFLFPPQRARAQVKSLSGGERARLLLARLFAQPANVVVLDEPTNDLDIETIELLEQLLQDYDGTVFIVSHDRTLLNNVVTQSYVFDVDGALREYAGGYVDWLAQRPSNTAAGSSTSKRNADAQRFPDAPTAERTPKPRARLSYKDQRELDQLPAQIEAMETEQSAINSELAAGEVYVKDPERSKNIAIRLSELEALLAKAYARWGELEG